MRKVVLVALGAACLLPLAAIDPAIALMMFDLELLAAVGSAGVAITRGDLRAVLLRLRTGPTVVSLVAGWQMTRENPASLLRA